MNAPVRRPYRCPARVVVALAALVVPLAACSGDGGGEAGPTPEDVLAAAKQALDETSGVTLSLATEALPEGVDGIVKATGVAKRVQVATVQPGSARITRDVDAEAVAAVQDWIFEPAKMDGRPVAVYYTLTVNFQIQR